jgi:hypothetical protein
MSFCSQRPHDLPAQDPSHVVVALGGGTWFFAGFFVDQKKGLRLGGFGHACLASHSLGE